jgi:hypothetical protein
MRRPPAGAQLPFGPAQKQRLGFRAFSSTKINCEFLAFRGWQIEGEQRSFGDAGYGAVRTGKTGGG